MAAGPSDPCSVAPSSIGSREISSADSFLAWMPAEVANVLRRAVLAADVSPDAAGLAYADLLDLPVLGRCGLAGAPADGAPEVRQQAQEFKASGK